MVPDTTRELIAFFRSQFEYRNGVLYWGPNNLHRGKKAGCEIPDGYIRINITLTPGEHKKFLAHRIIFAVAHGYMPDLVDHIDQNPRNNLLSNLRDASRKLNAVNAGLPITNTSGVKGVRLLKGKWQAYIHIRIGNKKKQIILGNFNTIEDATTARQQAERHYWADICPTN